MKKYALLTLCLVLTAALLTGCGCTNRNMDNKNTSAPTVLPTNEEVWDNTSEATSRPTMTESTGANSTEPSQTIDRGNGPLDGTDAANGGNGTNGTNGNSGTGATNETGSTAATDNTTAGRARQGISNGR